MTPLVRVPSKATIIRLVDAANGEKPGGRIKNAVFDAFVQAARAKRRA